MIYIIELFDKHGLKIASFRHKYHADYRARDVGLDYLTVELDAASVKVYRQEQFFEGVRHESV